MKYRTLGRTGIKVTPYALGAMMLGALGNPDRQEGIRIIHRALDAGINFVDTADRYGDSEEVVGEALKGRRDEVVLATKFWGPVDDDVNHRGGSRRWIMEAAERSLRRLQTDHIDLYQLHRPDPDTDIDETLSALTDLIRQGKVRAIGTSSMRGSEIVEAQWMSERRGFERFRTEQPNYSILDREIEREILPVAERYGMGTLVYSPLAGGALTGRYRAGQENDNFRSTKTGMRHFRDERRLAAVEELHRVLRRRWCEAHAPCDGVRHRAPRGHLRDRRTAHDGAAGGHACRDRRRAVGRGPRPYRRDCPARGEHRCDGHGLPRPRSGRPDHAPPSGRTAFGCLTQRRAEEAIQVPHPSSEARPVYLAERGTSRMGAMPCEKLLLNGQGCLV